MSAVVSTALWLFLVVAGLALWARSRRMPSSVAPPAAVVARLATGPVARVALVLGWMWLGWHLFAR